MMKEYLFVPLLVGLAVGLLVSLTVRSSAGQKDEKADPASFVFTNGGVYTVNEKQPWAEAVAVGDKKIVYVGGNAGVKQHIGPTTKVVDLKGKMLLPGFIEAHIHPMVGSAFTKGVVLEYDDTREALLKALKGHAKKVGKGKNLVRGYGWGYSAFPKTGPSKKDLDEIWPDRPVLLLAMDFHAGWANSRALEAAKVTKDTADPSPGVSYFQRDPMTGEPTGYLVELDAVQHVLDRIEPYTREFINNALQDWLPQASAAGITGVCDTSVVLLPESEAYAIYRRLEKQGKLPVRISGCYAYKEWKKDMLGEIKDLSKRILTELIQFHTVKFYIDGVDAQYTSAMLEPYTDKPETRGKTVIPPERFEELVRMVDKAGFDLHIHTYGDRSARLCLDAIEKANQANGPRDRRHTLCHLPVVHPSDLPRFAKLGVIAQFSIQWAVPDSYWEGTTLKRWGKDRANRMWQARTILEKGAKVTFGTDWPADSTFKPLDAIQVGLTRQELDEPKGPVLPPASERLTLAQLIRGYTRDAAYQTRLEDKVGSIEVGKHADLIVLEKDLFKVAPQDVAETRVLLTMMNGRVYHRDQAAKKATGR